MASQCQVVPSLAVTAQCMFSVSKKIAFFVGVQHTKAGRQGLGMRLHELHDSDWSKAHNQVYVQN